MAESLGLPGAEHGYPNPGPQHLSVDKIMTDLYFMSDKEWNEDRTTGGFDYVVIGSSFCALGFTHQMLKKNPKAKILIIERGSYFHPEHFQNLPLAYSRTVGGKSETFHWKITKRTHEGEYIQWQHGMNNFFGGRSSFWSGWCPKPTKEEMVEWPEEVITTVHEYFSAAEKLLNVIPSNKISSNEGKIFGALQEKIYKLAKRAPSEIEAITRVDFAPLAVKADMYRSEDYQKFSASGPLLNILLSTQYQNSNSKECNQPLKIITNCLVKKIRQENGRATHLETTKKDLTLGNAKVILAMGTLPPTTLMLNSFPASSFKQLSNIGKRFTSHFISAIIARVPVNDMDDKFYASLQKEAQGKLEIGALYITGENTESKHQFHIQLTAIIDETPVENIYDTFRHLPDVVAAPTLEQLLSSKNPPHVVFVCACLGQLDHHNEDNWFQLDEQNARDITSNTTLQVVANDKDNQLWATMDVSTFELLEECLASPGKLEYWHSDETWKKDRPSTKQIRVPGLVHEASTMWIGNDQDKSSPPVGLDYRFRGVENVYLTGGALWPTGASWNPTCAMTAMAMDLADKLCKK